MSATDAGWGYCIRVQAYEGYLAKSFVMMNDYEWVAGMTHKGDRKDPNPHYHFVIKTNIADGTIRKRMLKLFDKGKGNGHMSIKKWDGNQDAVAYLFHEDPDAPLTFCKGITDEYILDSRNRNKRVQVEVAKAKDNASWTLEEDVWNQIEIEQIEYRQRYQPANLGQREEYFTEKRYDQIALCKMIFLTALRKGKYAPNDYLMKLMVARLQFRLCKGDVEAEDNLADWNARRIYRD